MIKDFKNYEFSGTAASTAMRLEALFGDQGNSIENER